MLAVHWYLRYGLSYRDVEELLAERGITVDRLSLVHTPRDDLATSIHTATSMASTVRRPRTLCSPSVRNGARLLATVGGSRMQALPDLARYPLPR